MVQMKEQKNKRVVWMYLLQIILQANILKLCYVYIF